MNAETLLKTTPKWAIRSAYCRESFKQFVNEFWSEVPGAGTLLWNWHMDVLCEEMQAVAERVFANQAKRYDLIINISPGTSKSSVCSILFHPWTWTRMPGARHINASHTDSLVLDLANKARFVIESEKYQKYFPEVELRSDQNAKGDYANNSGGERKSCTVAGKTPTGRHAHFLITDDPTDPKKAISEAELKTAADFMTQVLPSRKVRTAVDLAVMITIMQRMGLNDPTEVLLKTAKKEGATRVRHVCLPAELSDDVKPKKYRQEYVDHDGLMDPVRLSRNVLNDFRARLGEYGYAGQFMQSPIPMKGGMFRAHWFNQRCLAAPYHAEKRIRYWDRASTDQGGCFTAGVLMSYSNGNYYVEHVEKGQWEPDERNERMKAIALRDRTRYGPRNDPLILIEREGGSSGRDAWKAIARVLTGFKVFEDTVTGSKDTRAEPWAAQCAAGNVYLVEDPSCPWDIEAYIQEHVLFRPEPGKRLGRYKDQVDASCLVAGTIVETSKGPKPIESIQAGEFVLTRQGHKEVEWAGESGRVSKTTTIQFKNGASLSGTGEHLIWTQARGFTTMDSLQLDDEFLCLEERTCVPESLFLTEFDSQEKVITIGERGVRIHCIELSGVSTMEQSHPIVTSITRMKIRLIMIHPILNASRRKSIGRDIGKPIGSRNNWSILSEYVHSQKNGMLQKKDEHGIRSMVRKRLRNVQQGNTNVLSVGRSTRRNVMDRRDLIDSALNCAQAGSVTLSEGRKSQKYVRCVPRTSWECLKSSVAPENAEHKCDGKIPVYDLRIKDAHEFFANGILVHNSGSFNRMIGNLASVGAMQIRTSANRIGSKLGFRIIPCTRQELLSLVVDEKALLVSFNDPGDDKLPEHGINKLLDSVVLQFADLDPAKLQDKWGEVLQPWNATPDKLVMQPSDGKRMWRIIAMKRESPFQVIVLVDPGNSRATSAAYAVADILHIPRKKVIWIPGSSDNSNVGQDAKAPNEHVYQVVKSSRAMVV